MASYYDCWGPNSGILVDPQERRGWSHFSFLPAQQQSCKPAVPGTATQLLSSEWSRVGVSCIAKRTKRLMCIEKRRSHSSSLELQLLYSKQWWGSRLSFLMVEKHLSCFAVWVAQVNIVCENHLQTTHSLRQFISAYGLFPHSITIFFRLDYWHYKQFAVIHVYAIWTTPFTCTG